MIIIGNKIVATNGSDAIKAGDVISGGTADLTNISHSESKQHKITLLGDYLTCLDTYPNNYPYWIKTRNPNLDITNLATESATLTNDLYTQSQSLSSTNCICILAGFNDWNNSIALGEFTTDYSDITTNPTFYKGLYRLLYSVKNTYPTTPILVLTPIIGTGTNSNGNTLKQFVDAIKEVAGNFAIPVCDLYSKSSVTNLTTTGASTFYADGYHLNSVGSERISYLIEDSIKETIEGFGGKW